MWRVFAVPASIYQKGVPAGTGGTDESRPPTRGRLHGEELPCPVSLPAVFLPLPPPWEMTPGLGAFLLVRASQDCEVGVVEGRRNDPYQDAGWRRERGGVLSRTIYLLHYCEMRAGYSPTWTRLSCSSLTCEEEKESVGPGSQHLLATTYSRVVCFLFLFYFSCSYASLLKRICIWANSKRWGDSAVSITRYSHLSEKRKEAYLVGGNHGQ